MRIFIFVALIGMSLFSQVNDAQAAPRTNERIEQLLPAERISPAICDAIADSAEQACFANGGGVFQCNAVWLAAYNTCINSSSGVA